MSDHKKDDFQNDGSESYSDDVPTSGGFTTAQLRALKWMTSIMGILIVICLILLAIGLSRNAEKLAKDDAPKTISLPASLDIKAVSASEDGSLWLYLQNDDEEQLQQITKKGKLGKTITIERE